jgi:uncharacterized protein (TIGR02466 family)|tara:strand:+ start:101 stop:754 length:654 start_codon:yes stop_codon:yes gene_type:complete
MKIDLFATDIWSDEFNNIDNEELAKFLLKKEQEEVTKKLEYWRTLKKTDLHYRVASIGGWQSRPDLFTENKENIQVKNLFKSIGKITDEIKIHNRFRKNVKTECVAMWVNVNRYKDYQQMHVHPHCDYSGVYYVKTSENCGTINLIDPRKERRMLINTDLWDSSNDLTGSNAGCISVVPKEGKIILFPSFLDHLVEPNLTHEPRISISFNIGFKVKG